METVPCVFAPTFIVYGVPASCGGAQRSVDAVTPGEMYDRGSPYHARRMPEGEPVRVLIGPQRRLVHPPERGEMRQQQTPELFPDQFRGLAAQDNARPAQVRLQLGQRPFDLPPLVIEGGQFRRRRLGRVEDCL